MAKRKNGEGSYAVVTIKGNTYHRYTDNSIGTVYAKSPTELEKKIKEKRKNASKARTLENIKQSNLSTFGHLLEQWLPTIRFRISERTYDDYESIINSRIKSYKGYDIYNKQLKSLIPKMFTDYFMSMASVYSQASIHKTWVVIKLALTYGIKKGVIDKDFAFDEIERPSERVVAVKKKDVPFITMSDMDKLYDELLSGKYGNSARLLVFIMYSGLRISEAVSLTWKYVDNDYSSIRVKTATSKVVERDDDLKPLKNEDGTMKHKYVIKGTKTDDSERIVPLPDRAIEQLEYFDNLRNHTKDDFVFVTSNNTPISSDNARRTLKRVLARSNCECKDYSPHSLRHGYGSILISEGVDIKIVSELLGHSDVAFTYNVYIGTLKKDKIDAVKRVFNKKDID